MACAFPVGQTQRAEVLLKCKTLEIDDAVDCMAVDMGNVALTQLLLARGADPDHLYDKNSIPLVVNAAARGHTRILRALISARADINVCDAEGHTPMVAAEKYTWPAAARSCRSFVLLKHVHGEHFSFA